MSPENIVRLMNVRDDTEADAKALDGTPFTPESVSKVLGEMLAMIWCLCDVLLDEEGGAS